MTQWNESRYNRFAYDPFSSSIEERTLAREQERLAYANSYADLNNLTNAGTDPPIVTGLTLVSNVNTIHVKWTASNIPDLRHYELQIALNSDFTDTVITKKTQEIEYIWEEGDVDTAYYIRVRAVNILGNPGPWSSRVNTLTGKVYTSLIEVDATTNVVRFVYGDDGGETFATLGYNGTASTEDYGNLTIDVFDSDSVVQPNIIMKFEYASKYPIGGGSYYTQNYQVGLYRREQGTTPWGTALNTAQIDVKSSVPSTYAGFATDKAQAKVPVFTNYDEPGQGIWEYMVRVTIVDASSPSAGAAWLTWKGLYLEMEFWQTKR